MSATSFVFKRIDEMSAVLEQTKQLYRKALGVEMLFLLVVLAVWAMLAGRDSLFSLFLGQIAAFVPHTLFAFWVFFRKTAKNTPKMPAFYRGEGLKWLCTIGLLSLAFIGYREMDYVAFFAGYLLALGANGITPIVLKLID